MSISLNIEFFSGMSDLCSPMIILLEDEADAFWCFERLMRRLRGNFRCTEQSLQLLKFLTPNYINTWKHLVEVTTFFCFPYVYGLVPTRVLIL
ncbi:hypothetical protein HPP92_001557 [Vanilla planifolia]|uniref:Rab-GAP TBC domain-containing protein n=1 Tax=Vanilla planifolia TaxID=51239 RepID=A0A835RZI2_VANPL|nr:hypothetical protein HPP92_001557 [Vanilla planifolia]